MSCAVCEGRRLWTAHVFLTREVGAVAILKVPAAALQASLDRLYLNQDDIGQWFGQVVNNTCTGNGLRDLLYEHIDLAVQIVQGLIAGDDITDLDVAWKDNARAIASYIAYAGIPLRYRWSEDIIHRHMLHHLELLTNEVVTFLNGDYVQSIEFLDQSLNAIQELSDYLVEGTGAGCCDK